MKDVIYRQDAIDAICEACYIGEEASHTECKEYQNLDSTWCEEIVALRNVPSAEPEIIWCKDCKHRGEEPIADGRYWCDIHDAFMYYCSDAERRTE